MSDTSTASEEVRAMLGFLGSPLGAPLTSLSQLAPPPSVGWDPAAYLPAVRRRAARTIASIDALDDELIEILDDQSNDDAQARLERGTTEASGRDLRTLLTDLADEWGVPWSWIARAVGVSVPALRKWRQGGEASPANRREVARLFAFLELAQGHGIEDPASWLGQELWTGVAITPLTIYTSNGGELLLLRFASGRLAGADDLLDAFDPTWRDRAARVEWETYVADDGEVRLRSSSQA